MRLRPPTPVADPRLEGSDFTLVEALVAMFVTTLILLTITELMITSLYVHRSATDVTETTALALERLEQLRNSTYDNLVPGGSIAVNVAGFSENLDTNNDGTDDYARRWEILDLVDRKEIRVQSIALLTTMGPAKEAILFVLVAPD